MTPITDWIKSIFRTFLLRRKFPTCIIYFGATLDRRSTLGPYSVIFRDATILESSIGNHTYVQQNTIISNATVGKFCSIARGASIGLPQHSITTVSTHPAFYLRHTPVAKTYADRDIFTTTKATVIGHDVWIGQNAIVMSGIRLGIGAIVGAGAVVTRDVLDYAVVGGVPARIIKFRFDKTTREELLESKWWDMPEEWLETNFHLFQDPAKLIVALRGYTGIAPLMKK